MNPEERCKKKLVPFYTTVIIPSELTLGFKNNFFSQITDFVTIAHIGLTMFSSAE